MSVLALEILDSAGVKYVWYRYSNQRIMILITESNATNMVTLSRNSRHLCSIMMTSSNWSIFRVTSLCEGNDMLLVCPCSGNLDSAGVRYVWYRYSNQRIMIIIRESNAYNTVTLSRNSRHLSSIFLNCAHSRGPIITRSGHGGRSDIKCHLTSKTHYMHYGDVIMSAIASQITSLMIVHSTVYSDADQRKHQSSASLAFVRRIHRGPVNSPHKWPVTRKKFPLDDVIMNKRVSSSHFIMGIAIHIIQRPYIESDPCFGGSPKSDQTSTSISTGLCKEGVAPL